MVYTDTMNLQNFQNDRHESSSSSSSSSSHGCKAVQNLRFRNPIKSLLDKRKACKNTTEVYDETATANLSVYSIPISNEQLKIDHNDDSSIQARRFLDLTIEELPLKKENRGFSMIRLSVTNWFVDTSTLETASLCSSDDDDSDCDSETDFGEDMDPWHTANAALIQEVHEVSSRLEDELKKKGSESPYQEAKIVFPSFRDLHQHTGRDLNQKKTERKKEGLRRSTIEDSFFELDEELDSRIRNTRKVSAQKTYLKRFFYDKHDGTCSLPLALAYGLEKRLSEDDVASAIDILNELTSPLRNWRHKPVDRVESIRKKKNNTR